MKKTAAMLLALVMTVSLCACSGLRPDGGEVTGGDMDPADGDVTAPGNGADESGIIGTGGDDREDENDRDTGNGTDTGTGTGNGDRTDGRTEGETGNPMENAPASPNGSGYQTGTNGNVTGGANP